MAKLKAPLMSLGAAGKLGNALVFFGWKGLDVVREYVIPSNPKTTGQTTQRGYLSDAVDLVHTAQASAASPLTAADIQAYALLASTFATPRTWFNQAVKDYITQKVASLKYVIWGSCSVTPGVDKLTFKAGAGYVSDDAVTDGDIYWGTSKTALINVLACTVAQFTTGKDIPGLTTGVKYYCQYRTNVPVGYAGSRTGIYYGVPI